MYKRCGLSHSAIVDMSEVVALEEARERRESSTLSFKCCLILQHRIYVAIFNTYSDLFYLLNANEHRSTLIMNICP